MQIEAFRNHMAEQNLADKTRYTREMALLRVEKFEGVELDAEFERDGMEALLDRFRYSREDSSAGRANPTRMNISPGNELSHLNWYRSHLNAYREFRTVTPDDLVEEFVELVEPGESMSGATPSNTFVLERQMQAALRVSIDQLEPGLRIVDGGSEIAVEAGRIDILAEDASGTLVVIELKAGPSKADVIAQTLAYMASIAAERSRSVRGLIVASDHPLRVVLAAQAVSNLSLKTYRYRFEFS